MREVSGTGMYAPSLKAAVMNEKTTINSVASTTTNQNGQVRMSRALKGPADRVTANFFLSRPDGGSYGNAGWNDHDIAG
jgi:hypothetical protein